jgi:hypothetical protein
MVGVKHEHAPSGSDGSLTSREQRAMLYFEIFRPKRIYSTRRAHIYMYKCIHSFIHPKRRRKSGEMMMGVAHLRMIEDKVREEDQIEVACIRTGVGGGSV